MREVFPTGANEPIEEASGPQSLDSLEPPQLAYAAHYHETQSALLRELPNDNEIALSARLGQLDGEADFLRRLLAERRES